MKILSATLTKSVYSHACSAISNSSKISFKSYPVYLFDGGKHADDISRFAKINDDQVEIKKIQIETNKKEPELKQFKSLNEELKRIKEFPVSTPIALLCAFFTPVLNVNDRLDAINSGFSQHLTSSSMKEAKPYVMSMLKSLRDYPDIHAEQIKYIDPLGLGVEYIYDVIMKINNLVQNGYQIYIPASHSNYQSVKHLKKERNISSELYKYIADGKDSSGQVSQMLSEVKSRNWLDINLLEFSDAHIVNMIKPDGKPFIYGSIGDCVTDEAVGVYNLTPVRKNGAVVGFSYTDTVSNQLPKEQFKEYNEVKGIAKFVGKNINEVKGTDEDLLKYQKGDLTTPKLFKLNSIFSQEQISERKLDLLGNYTDGENVFDVNKDGIVIFQKTNVEGNDKPSVMAMWGNCFAVFSAIKSYAESKGLRVKRTNITQKPIENLDLDSYIDTRHFEYGIKISKYTDDNCKISEILKEASIYEFNNNISEAIEKYNDVMNIVLRKARIISSQLSNPTLSDINKHQLLQKEYYKNVRKYGEDLYLYRQANPLARLFWTEPQMPAKNYNETIANYCFLVKDISVMYQYLGNLYTKQGDYLPKGRNCQVIANRLLTNDFQGNEIFKRIINNQYLEDIL